MPKPIKKPTNGSGKGGKKLPTWDMPDWQKPPSWSNKSIWAKKKKQQGPPSVNA